MITNSGKGKGDADSFDVVGFRERKGDADRLDRGKKMGTRTDWAAMEQIQDVNTSVPCD
jgi:hypothetical protein